MLENLDAFIKTAELGSFSAAARALSVAPSSVTRSVDRLEQALKVQLFRRSTRKVSLTPDGEQYLRDVLLARTILDQAAHNVSSERQEPSGQLGISCFELFGKQYLLPAISTFLKRYPNISVFLDLGNQVVDLYEDAYDLVIRTGIPSDTRVIARPITHFTPILCASPEYLAQAGVPQSPDDLVEHNCLTRYRGRQQSWWYFNRDNQTQKIKVTGNFQSIGGDPLIQMALDHVGIALTVESMIQDELEHGQLVRVLPEWNVSLSQEKGLPVHMLYLPAPYLKPAMRAFIDFFLEWMQDRP